VTAESWISVGRQAACALGLAAAAAGWGEIILRGLRVPPIDRSPWRLGVGLLTLLTLAFLAALVGALTVVPILLLSAAGWLGAVLFVRPTPRVFGADPSAPPLGTVEFVWRFALVASLVLLFIATLYPPHAFDETTYHLPMAASLAEHGEVRWLDHLRVPVFPQSAEALAAALLVFGGSPATHLVQALALAALVLLLAGDGPIAGRLSGGFVLGSPLLIYQSSSLYVDVLSCLAVVIALRAAERFRATGDRRWWLLSAFGAGVAPTIKYLGGLGSILAFVLVVTAPGLAASRRWRLGAAYGAFAAALALPTFGWLFWTTGNPVFPFASALFGETPWSPLGFQTTGLSRLAEFVLLPWNAFANRSLAGSQPPPSPWLWLALLAALGSLVPGGSVGARLFTICASSYVALSLALHLLVGASTGLDIRYLLPAGVLFALAAGRAVSARWVRPTSLGVSLVIAALALPGIAYASFQLWRLGETPLTAVERTAFLVERHEGYAALRAAERESERVYVVGNERLVGLGAGEVYGEVQGRLPVGEATALLASPRVLADRLDRLGVGALVVLRRAWPSGSDRNALVGSGRFEDLFEDDQAWAWRVTAQHRR
jgi:hypothetical protein